MVVAAVGGLTTHVVAYHDEGATRKMMVVEVRLYGRRWWLSSGAETLIEGRGDGCLMKRRRE